MGALTVGGRLPPIENELVVSRQPVLSSGDQPAATISSPYMHLSECFTGGHPPPPLSGGHPPPPLASAAAPPPISRHSPDYQVGLSPVPSTLQMMKPVFQHLHFQNSPIDLPDTSLTCGDDSVFLPSSPTTKAFSPTALPTSPDPLQQTTGAFAHLGMAGPEVPSAPGRLIAHPPFHFLNLGRCAPIEFSITGHLNLPPCATLPLRTPQQQRLSLTRTK